MSKDLDKLAADLAYARQAAHELAHTLVGSRAYRELVTRLQMAFDALDNGGAFREIDEHTEYESAEDTIARTEAASVTSGKP